MEEIDGIVIESLKNLHCDIEDRITSLKHFDVDLIVTSISTCLETILPGTTFPKKLPPSMSHKLRITSNLAEQIKELGFRGDMGYQTILYCNEAEIRRVLMFLIERLPRETGAKIIASETGYVPRLVKDIEQRVKESMEQFWVPSNVLKRGYRTVEGGVIFNSMGDSYPIATKNIKVSTSSDLSEELKQYFVHNVPEVTKQCSERELLPSLLFSRDCEMSSDDDKLRVCLNLFKNEDRINDLSLDFPSSETMVQKSDDPATVVPVPVEENRIQTLVSEIKETKTQLVHLQEELKNSELKLSKTQARTLNEENNLQETLANITLKSKTLTIISNKAENLQKLKTRIENSNNKLLHLSEQWNDIQTPLLEEFKSLRNILSHEELELQTQQTKLTKLQETVYHLSSDLQDKLQIEEQLKQKLGQLNKNHNRAAYTRRILEIISNIKKQDEEIQKILKDTRDVQREISSLQGQVDRSFTLSDELIFRDAKQDEVARKAYKLLAQLRDECSSIIKGVTDLGLVERECRNLQEQIDTESAKEVALKLERVYKDLEEIKRETKILVSS